MKLLNMQNDFIFEWIATKEKPIQLEILCSLHAVATNRINIPRGCSTDLASITKPIDFYQQLDALVQSKISNKMHLLDTDQIESVLKGLEPHAQIVYDHLRFTPFVEDSLFFNASLDFIKNHNLNERHLEAKNFQIVYAKYIKESNFDDLKILEMTIKNKINKTWQSKWENSFDNEHFDLLFIQSLYDF